MRASFAKRYSEWLICTRNGGSCGAEPVDTCIPEACRAVPFCGGAKVSPEPTTCEKLGNGYYQPPGQCNRDCCPPDAGTQNYGIWHEGCVARFNEAMQEYQQHCVLERAADCGAAPVNTCESVPAECQSGASTGEGTYTSPVIPGAAEGHVLDWGLLIVNATFGGAGETMSIEVFVHDATGDHVLATYDLDGGSDTYTFDLRGVVDPSLYASIQVRALMTGHAGSCMQDMVPGDATFAGTPTGLNAGGRVVGAQIIDGAIFDGQPAYGAWTWQEGDADVTSLHDLLPVLPELDVNATWQESYASDINDGDVVVGWADPGKVAATDLPAGCQVQYPSDVRFARNNPSSANAGGVGITGTRRAQWIVPAGDIAGGAVDISGLALRTDPFSPSGFGYFDQVTVSMGYTSRTSVSTQGWFATFETEPVTVYSGPVYFTLTPTDGDYDLQIPFGGTSFPYDPSQGSLVIDLQLGPSFHEESNVVIKFVPGTPGTGPFTLYSNSPGDGPSAYQPGDNYPATQLNLPVEPDTTENLMVWRKAGTAWTAACLPTVSTPTRRFEYSSEALRSSLVYINAHDVIAGSSGARRETRQFGDSALFGTPTVFCPTAGLPSGYEARPIKDNEGTYALPAAVTGLNDRSVVIGVGLVDPRVVQGERLEAAAAAFAQFHALAWVPSAISFGGCVEGWRQIDLTNVLAATLDGVTPAEVVPLDVDELNNVSGVYRDPFSEVSRYLAVTWHWDGEGYSAETLLPDGFGESSVSAALSAQWPLAVSFAATQSIDSGRVTLTALPALATDILGSGFAWVDGAFSAIGLGESDVVIGSHGTTALGIGLANQVPTAWVDSPDGGLVMLGSILPNGIHIPLYGNDDALVVGTYYAQSEVFGQRVFTWRQCGSGTPRLDDWTVTYQTDKNPSWGFEVELGDVCTTSVSNAADIATSTPEITLANNSSRTSMSVNTADLAATVDLDATVVRPGELLSGDVTFANLGPGTAKDVDIMLQLPERCGTPTVAYGTGIIVSNGFYDAGANTYHGTLARLDAGQALTAHFTCTNGISVAGTTLVAAAGLASPTIDCDAGNDTATQGVVVGDFPNLWVTVLGPSSAPIGQATPYELTFGNNGNTAVPGTVILTAPTGATLEIGTLPAGVTVEVSGTTAVFTTGVIAAGAELTVPFELTWDTCVASETQAVSTASIETANGSAEADIADNSAAATTLVSAPVGVLTLDIERSDASVELGKELVYTFHVANAGSQAASGTRLAIAMPAGLQIVAVTPAAAFSAGAVTLPVGRKAGASTALGAGDTGAVTVRAKVVGTTNPTSGVGTVQLLADAGACGVSASILPPSVAPADSGLHVLVSASQPVACAASGQRVDWTVTVTNPSAVAVAAVPVTVTVPAGLAYVPGSIVGRAGTDAAAPQLGWVIDLPAHGVLSVGFATSVKATSGLVVVSATAGLASASGDLRASCEPRVGVQKAWDLTCGVVGGTYPIVLTVTNATAAPVTGTLTDSVAQGLTPVVVAPATFDAATRVLSLGQTTVAPGQTVKVSYSVTIAAGSSILFGDPIVDRAVFAAAAITESASNQVGGGIADCGAVTHCASWTCDAYLGCQAVPNPEPGVERCGNAADDDCDGQTDEGFPTIGQACDGQDADLCKRGTFVCDEAGTGTTCQETGPGATETCNGQDDDCDGQTDEGYAGLGQPCDGNDSDACLNGTNICAPNGQGIVCLELGAPKVETCNAQDDDCDGQTDEGFGLGGPCTVGIGECTRTGLLVCSEAGATQCSVVPGPIANEICDGKDNDCDGQTDDGVVAGTSACVDLETEITDGPPPVTASTTAVFTYVNPLYPPHTTFQCSLDGGPWVECDDGTTTYTGLSVTAHTLLVRATRGDGAVDPTPAFYSWLIDQTVPDTLILAGPGSPSQNPDGTFVFGATVPNPDFYRCVIDPAAALLDPETGCPALDSEAYATCPATFAFTGLADGTHTICVYVTDTEGTPDPVPASASWIIDTTAPETVITDSPPKLTAETTAVLDYMDPTAPETMTFECSLDGGAWVECDGQTTTYEELAEGEHTFLVRTIDEHGVKDPTPAQYTWVIDITAPCASIVVHPTDPAQSGTAVFGFSASEPDATFRCALDPVLVEGQPGANAYVPCDATTRFSALADGQHQLWVYAVDAVGNAGPSAGTECVAQFAWLIDTRYSGRDHRRRRSPGGGATLDYVDPTDPELHTFECSLDGAEWTRCDGGSIDYTPAQVPVGPHTFIVRACDFTKAEPVQCDPTPATWTWEVTESPCPNDRVPPSMTCAGDLVLECKDGGATLALAELQPEASDLCMPVEVTSSATATVGLGTNPLVFVGTDPNGNMASCVTLVSVVDVTAPAVTCPADITTTTDPGVCGATVAIAPAAGLDACQGAQGLLALDDAPEQFAPGTTTVTHHVVDAFGNDATCTQEVVVTDDEPMTLTCSASETVDADADKCEWSGVSTALATDNCSDELTVDVDGTYPVGVSPILFTATDEAGNEAECTTELTVRDVTAPAVVCGTAVGLVPAVIRATATDACTAVVTLEDVTCASVSGGTPTPVALADCPVAIHGDAIEITGRLPTGVLALAYKARAVDPSGNATVVDCQTTYDPDADGDGVVDAGDNCPTTANPDQTDSDGDGLGDVCDVCAEVADPAQADRDGDGIGDACSDKDKDGVLDRDDNCELVPNTSQEDLDQDGVGDACDPAGFDGLTASGSGGCASGSVGLPMGVFAALALLLMRRRRTARGADLCAPYGRPYKLYGRPYAPGAGTSAPPARASSQIGDEPESRATSPSPRVTSTSTSHEPRARATSHEAG
ncbi:MAG: HYR domain-containing protein [Myxococcota bacterium]